MRILFMGTPEFACPSLTALARSRHEVVAVITRRDKPRGRGRHLAPPPVKAAAEKLGIPVHQPVALRSPAFLENMRALGPDLAAVVAFGALLSRDWLELPPYGCINLHPSLLPKYRGAAPINWAVINGESKTGVTVFKIVEDLDAGDILLQRETPIGPDQTAGDLHDLLAELGAAALVEAVDAIEDGAATFIPQDSRKATLAPQLRKEDGIIDWRLSARTLRDFIRGMTPWPGACTELKRRGGKRPQRVAILSAAAEQAPPQARPLRPPGKILAVRPGGILVAAGEGGLLITRLKPAGAKAMSAAEYVRGHTVGPGDEFVPPC